MWSLLGHYIPIYNIFYRGSAIAKIVGRNAASLSNFEDRVTMWVYEEIIEGKKLTEIINETHENVKYLPGHKLPSNVVSKKKFINNTTMKIYCYCLNKDVRGFYSYCSYYTQNGNCNKPTLDSI